MPGFLEEQQGGQCGWRGGERGKETAGGESRDGAELHHVGPVATVSLRLLLSEMGATAGLCVARGPDPRYTDHRGCWEWAVSRVQWKEGNNCSDAGEV